MAKLRMQSSNLNGHLKAMHIVESSACSCGFVNEDMNSISFLDVLYLIDQESYFRMLYPL